MGRERAMRSLGWISLVVLLAAVFGRAVCPAEPFPWWEADAFGFAPPIVGLTPTRALLLDLVIMVASAGVVVSTRGGPGRIGAVLLAIGLGVIGWHAARDMETVSAGADLGAGMAALVAAWAGSRLPGARRVMVGLALGFGVMLAAVGAQETFIEHPRTLESFEAGRDEFYRARGWEPGGAEAAMYEERLSHAQPTGWFGLTNVLATFAGASAVGLLAAALGTGSGTRAVRLCLVAGAVASAWVLMMTGSKGGIGAAAFVGLVVGVVWARRRVWIGRAVLGAAVLVVLAVAARGIVGERIGEMSLLVRSHYQRGTLSVWLEHPVVGVGPGNFQDAYTRLKPERATEEVTSPHSVAFDWVGLLGMGGVAWVGLVGIGLIGTARAGASTDGIEPHGTVPAPSDDRPDPARVDIYAGLGPPSARTLVRISAGVVAACVLGGAYVGQAAMAPEGALALLIGGVGWAVIAGVVCTLAGDLRAAGLAAGAVALVHGQLDVTPVWTVSAPLWGLLVGVLIGAIPGRADRPAGRMPGWQLAAAAMVLLGGVLGARLPTLVQWERGLDRAAAWPRMIATARLDLAIASDPADPTRLRALAERLSGWIGRPVPGSVGPIRAALEETVMRSQEDAVGGLIGALTARPRHTGTRIALGRVLLTIASRDRGRGSGVWADGAAWRQAVSLAEEGVVVRPDDPSTWSWLGTVWEQGAALEPDLGVERLGRAAGVWAEGDRLTPHAPASAARIAEALDRAGRTAEAAEWAARALARDDWLVLDPRRRLNPARRNGLEGIARGGAGASEPRDDAGRDRGRGGSDPGFGTDVP